MSGQTPVPNSDPILDAPYGDAGLRLGLLDAATLVRAKQEQKRLLRSGTVVSLRQLLLQSGMIGPEECRRIEGKLKIRVVDEQDEQAAEVPDDSDRGLTDVLIEPAPPPEVLSDSESTSEDNREPEAESAGPELKEAAPPPSEQMLPPAMATAAEDAPEILEPENGDGGTASDTRIPAPQDIAGYLDDVTAIAGGEAAAQEAVALVFEEAATGEDESRETSAAHDNTLSENQAEHAPEPETPAVLEPVHVTAPYPAPAILALPSPVPQPTLTPAMIAAAANAPTTASKGIGHPDGHRPWYRRPTRLLAAGLLAFILVLLLGTAYSPQTGFFRSFLPGGGESNAVTRLFGWWNQFASETIGGELLREDLPGKRRR